MLRGKTDFNFITFLHKKRNSLLDMVTFWPDSSLSLTLTYLTEMYQSNRRHTNKTCGSLLKTYRQKTKIMII